MIKSSNIPNKLVVIGHNIRSAHNVGSLFRTCEGAGVLKLILTGYSPYPLAAHDSRLPHIAKRLNTLIDKTALGTSSTLKWSRSEDILSVIANYRQMGYEVIGLEQTAGSTAIIDYRPATKTLLILGNEVSGIENEITTVCDRLVEIPMKARKESFNVVQAAAMAIFYICYL